MKFLMSRLLYFYLVRMNFLLARNFLESCTGPAQWHTVLSLLKVLNHASRTLPRLPDTCPGLPRTFLTIPEQKSQEVLGQLGTSRDVLADMTTKVLGPKVSRSPGTTQDILGCPTRLDYQSPMSNKISQEVLGHSGTSWDVIPTNDKGLLAFHFYAQFFYTCMKRHWKEGSGKLRVMQEGPKRCQTDYT